MENIYDIIAWGRVVTQGKEYILLSPKPYHSEMMDGKIGRSMWQMEGTTKWEVADSNDYKLMNLDERVYSRSIIIFGSDALIEFYQDPKTIKVKYITPDGDDDVSGNPI